MDELDYRLNQAISYTKVNRWESFANYKYRFSNKHEVKVSARHNYIEANNQNYESGGAIEQRYSLGALFKGQITEGIDYALHLRQQLVAELIFPHHLMQEFPIKQLKIKITKLNLKLNSLIITDYQP